MTLRVIGAGFGRTGTTSLKAALEELGYGKCYHMTEVMKNPSHAYFWRDVMEGKDVDWRGFFADYQSTVDWPSCDYYRDLMAIYPDAKVLLNIREPESWYVSTLSTIYRVPNSLLMRMISLLIPHMRVMYPLIDEKIWRGIFHNRFEEKEFAIEIFTRHNESVKEFVPAERLLVYNVKEGWEPLCNFLNVPVPAEPFPHLNDRVLMQRAMRWGPVMLLLVVGILLWLMIQLALMIFL